jgi:uncharacterized protein YbgA (DUF1722 family)
MWLTSSDDELSNIFVQYRVSLTCILRFQETYETEQNVLLKARKLQIVKDSLARFLEVMSPYK